MRVTDKLSALRLGRFNEILRLLLAIVITASASIAFGQATRSKPSYHPTDILVSFADGGEEQVADLCAPIHATPVTYIADLNTWKIRLRPGMHPLKGVAYFSNFPTVTNGQPNYDYQYDFDPNDPSYPTQYAPFITNCRDAWDICQGSPDVVIAIIDSGVDLTHPDLQGKLVPGFDFGENDADPMDNQGHGTRCAGAAGAATNNSVGLASSGFNSRIMPLKASDAATMLRTDALVQCILFAENNGADVISMSFGSGASDTLMHMAIQRRPDLTFVAAAGNANSPASHFPAAFPEVIAVGATDDLDQKASFSNFGANWVDVAAPGEDVLTLDLGGGFGLHNGTSYAAPWVAGIAALLRSYFGTSSETQADYVRECIEETCDNIGAWVDHGRVNAFAAMTYIPAGMSRTETLPYDFTPTYGTYFSGGVSDLAISDDQYLTFDALFYSGVVYVFRGTASSQITLPSGAVKEIQVRLEPSVNTANVAASTVYLLRWSDSTWIHIGSMLAKTWDQPKLFRQTHNPADFVDPSGEIHVAFQVDSTFPFQVKFDSMSVAVLTQ